MLFDDFAHVAADLVGGGDGGAGPGFEAVAEGVEVAVGADAGVFVGVPGAAVAGLGFEHDEALAGELGLQVVAG